jgi:acyl carrier protein
VAETKTDGKPGILARVQDMLSAVMEMPASEFTPRIEMDMLDVWTSIKHIQLIVALEQEFGVEFTDPQIMRCRSVAGIVNVLVLECGL